MEWLLWEDTRYFDTNFINNNTTFKQFAALHPFKDNGTGLFWFRTCLTFNGSQGREFATQLSKA